MKWCRFQQGDRISYGIVNDDRVVEVDGSPFDSYTETDRSHSLDQVKLLTPVDILTFYAAGTNYPEHVTWAAKKLGREPQIPAKADIGYRAVNAIIAHDENIVRPKDATDLHYEGELVAVIGKQAKNVKAADCEDYVFGYTCVHDVSARDYQLATSQWTIGKTFDSFGPMGPTLVSKDEIDNPSNLRIWFDLNGEILQDSNTNQLVFDVPALLEYLSSVMTLQPGDIVSTGTPPGVGMARRPPIFLKPGDVCTVGIEGIGELVNPCVSEQG